MSLAHYSSTPGILCSFERLIIVQAGSSSNAEAAQRFPAQQPSSSATPSPAGLESMGPAHRQSQAGAIGQHAPSQIAPTQSLVRLILLVLSAAA